MQVNKSNILDYWRAIELFSPQKIDKNAPQNTLDPVFEITEGHLPPWDSRHPLQKRSKSSVKWKYIAYCGLYKLDTISKVLTDIFGVDKDYFDEYSNGETAIFSISLTSEGKPAFDSFVLSTCAWACGRLKNPGPKKPFWLDGFEEVSSKLLYHLKENLKIDADANMQGDAVTNKNTFLHTLFDEIKYFIDELGVHYLGVHSSIRIKAIRLNQKHSNDDSSVNFLNSFYIQDLQKVSMAIKSNNFGMALKTYLSEDNDLPISNRIDLRKEESLNLSFSKLSPSNIPIGCWPSKNHHPLVYAQQLAINSIFSQLSDKPGIFSVNGPPGTGKTTLLRDIISGIIVNRAIKISQLKEPSEAFQGKSNWQTGTYTRSICHWKEGFKGYEIVIASSNNGAVENVTLEIPSLTAIDPSWQEQIDYFPDVASILIEQPAWALLAAKLGKKKNCSEFVQNIWNPNNKENDNSNYDQNLNNKKNLNTTLSKSNFEGLWKYFQYLKETKLSVNWDEAVANFKSALSEEQSIRDKYIKTYNKLVEKQKYVKQFKEAKNKLFISQNKLLELRETLKKLEREEQEASFLLDQIAAMANSHRKQRPSLLQILLSLGKAYFRWNKRQLDYQIELQKIQTIFNECKINRQNQEKLLKNGNKQADKLLLETKDLETKISNIDLAISQQKKLLGHHLPDLIVWQNDELRELSSPWLEPKWNKARMKVFIEALNLHKTFIEANSEIFRKNLHAAMDILSGLVPTTAPIDGIRSAWTTFFYLVPVVSTTFASFDRLFSHLGKENIGWLLIDEAGQANPQSAVGALWRSKRAIVVGDPLQLEPINNIPFTAQQALTKHFKVTEKWLPSRLSTQSLADDTNLLGTYLPKDEKFIWVGCPLRVHRRCDNPMFNISNVIAYDNMMVFGTPQRSALSLIDSCWIDVKGQTFNDNWIVEEGQIALNLLKQLVFSSNIKPKDVFFISPFRAVIKGLHQITKGFEGINIGSIHTVQGKEADIIVLVLGGNPNKPGAKNWAAQKPNLLNVAASRAKRRLYVIGDKGSWQQRNFFNLLAKSLPTNKNILP